MGSSTTAGGDDDGENPTGGPDGEVARFAERLRRLRLEAGSPSFRQLARITHYSSSTLAEATAGRRLPTEAVVRAYVTGCGAEPAGWIAQLHEVARAGRGPSRTGYPPPDTPESPDVPGPPDLEDLSGRHPGPAPGRARGRLVSRWIRIAGTALAACGLVMAGATVEAALGTPGRPVAGTPGTPGAAATADPSGMSAASGHGTRNALAADTPAATDGADPAAAGCAGDARLVDKTPVMLTGVQIGALELKWSPRCRAGWARLYLYPGQRATLGRVRVASADGRLAEFADPLVHQVPVYTDVIRLNPHGCLSAWGAVSVNGHPPATATIPCQAPPT